MRFVESAFCGIEATLQAATRATAASPPGSPSSTAARSPSARTSTRRPASSRTKALVLDSGQAKALAAELDGRGLHRRRGHREALHQPPLPAVHDLDPAAGGGPQAALQRPAHHADRPEPLRERLHHLYAYRLAAPCRGEALSAARRQVERALRRRVPARQPRVYRSKSKSAQEAHEAIRPAGERFRTPNEPAIDARRRPVQALRADLEAHPRLADEGRHRRPHPGPDRGAHRRAGHRGLHDLGQGHHLPRLPPRLCRGLRRPRGRAAPTRRRSCRKLAAGRAPRRRRRSSPPATPPSRRRATPRPAWSRSSRRAASAARRPTPPSSRPSRIAATCGTRVRRWCPPSRPSR